MASVSLRQDARPAHRTSGPLGAVALAVLLALLSVTLAPTAAANGYPAEVETSCSLDVSSGDRLRPGSNVTVTVSSDAGQPQGSATFRLDRRGARTAQSAQSRSAQSSTSDEATYPLVNGQATHQIPFTLKPGRYTLSAAYNPATPGVKPSSASADIIVVAGGSPGDGNGTGGDNDAPAGGDSAGGTQNTAVGGAGGDTDQAGVGGILPNTGGVALWLLLAGLALLVAGALLLARRRATA